MKFRKLLILLLVAATLTSLIACGKDNNDITYREEGLTFTLPKSMRRMYGTGNEFHLSSPDSVFVAKKLDGDFMLSQALPADTTPKEYVDAYIENQLLDRERIDFKEDASRGTYSFKYNQSDAGEDYYHYVTVLGESGAIWFIEMMCLNDKADIYTETFEMWQKTISTYKE
jgi:hypothetical protein